MSAHVKDRCNLKSIALQTEVSWKNDTKMFIRGYCFRDISFYKSEIRVISKVHPGLRTLQGGAYTTAAGSVLWNKIPSEIRKLPSLNVFKTSFHGRDFSNTP